MRTKLKSTGLLWIASQRCLTGGLTCSRNEPLWLLKTYALNVPMTSGGSLVLYMISLKGEEAKPDRGLK